MKKTYNKLDSELVLVENEFGFMACSGHVRPLEVEGYKEYFSGTSFPNDSFDISFDD